MWHYDAQAGEARFQLCHGFLLVPPDSVALFNQSSRFSQAIVNSVYFYDATMQDWMSTANTSQEFLGALVRGGMALSGDFLGLLYNLSGFGQGTF